MITRIVGVMVRSVVIAIVGRIAYMSCEESTW